MAIDLPLTVLPLKEALSDIYQSSKGPIKKKFKNYVTNRSIKNIYDHLRSIGKVRTIWQTDRPVPVKAFYYPQKITFDNESTPIRKLSDMTQMSNRVIIQGIVGQGKSILLRYLCIEELKKLLSIPVFLELRKFVKEKTLTEQIMDYLDDIGLDSTQDTFEHLASNNKLYILLDAYDEIEENIEKKVFIEIERLCRKYPKLVIIITSRPNYPIQNSELFTLTTISELDDSDLKPILDKLCPNMESAIKIYEGINNSGGSVKTLLTTPLMVSLLVFVYKSDQKIPKKPIEFYDSLFITVLSRHDKQKPGGVNRNRKTTLSDTSFQKIFDCISFLSSQDSKTSLKEGEIITYIDQAKDYYNETFNSDDHLNEICKITCLILKDGFDYNYIHKTIQEYHAAKFITSIPESKAIEFYSGIIKDGKWKKWREQINFLIELDKYRCHKYFILPSCTLAEKTLFSKSGKFKRSFASMFVTLKSSSSSNLSKPAQGPMQEVIYSLRFLLGIALRDEYTNYISDQRFLYLRLNGVMHSNKFLFKEKYSNAGFLDIISSNLKSYINDKRSEANAIIKQLENTDCLFKL